MAYVLQWEMLRVQSASIVIPDLAVRACLCVGVFLPALIVCECGNKNRKCDELGVFLGLVCFQE